MDSAKSDTEVDRVKINQILDSFKSGPDFPARKRSKGKRNMVLMKFRKKRKIPYLNFWLTFGAQSLS